MAEDAERTQAMIKRIASMAAVAGLAGMLAVFTSAGPASAHEERKVGNYMLAVGFGDEPAYAGTKNSVQMFLHNAKTDKPVIDLGDTLKVDVTQGAGSANDDSQKLTMSMEPDFEVGEFGTPGDYRAFFIPTVPGTYTFHLTGSIKGQKVDEKFTSGPNTFADVDDPSQVQFPAKDPSGAQLSARLDREVPRLNTALAASQSRANKAEDAAGQARIIAIVGVVVGVLGLAAAGFAMRKRA
jgi:hypothetical protein